MVHLNSVKSLFFARKKSSVKKRVEIKIKSTPFLTRRIEFISARIIIQNSNNILSEKKCCLSLHHKFCSRIFSFLFYESFLRVMLCSLHLYSISVGMPNIKCSSKQLSMESLSILPNDVKKQ
jgi:hypothetical protein